MRLLNSLGGADVDPNQIEEKLITLLSSIRTALPDIYLGNVPELVATWEFKVAIEILCDHIGDQCGDICPRSVYPDLIAVAQELGVDPRYWESIRPD